MDKSFLFFDNTCHAPLPEEFRNQDIRLAKDFVEYVIEKYSNKEDVILDPFAGYSTALIAAEEMGRSCYGIEADEARYKYGLTMIKNKNRLIHGNSLELEKYHLPMLDLVFFSPPYMHQSYDKNPLRNESHQENCYANYLTDLLTIGVKIKQLLKEDKYLIVEAANLVDDNDSVTTLAWDIANSFKTEFQFVKEYIICWNGGYGSGYDHSYCLVFRKRRT
ncbi:MAG: DNA methyltransferase [Candidatus Rifleibacteriota bacterium]